MVDSADGAGPLSRDVDGDGDGDVGVGEPVLEEEGLKKLLPPPKDPKNSGKLVLPELGTALALPPNVKVNGCVFVVMNEVPSGLILVLVCPPCWAPALIDV